MSILSEPNTTPQEIYEDRLTEDEVSDFLGEDLSDIEPSRDLKYGGRTEEEYREAAEKEAKEFAEAMVFLTSGSTSGKGTPVPYTERDWERSTETAAQALRIMGLDEDDLLLNLAAEPPHSSGLAWEHGMERIGGGTVNNSYEDFDSREEYEEFIDFFDQVTSMIAVPGVDEDIGDQITDDLGQDLTEVFPQMETAVVAGRTIEPEMRDRVKRQWGAERTREYYGITETNFVAAADDETGDLIPLADKYYFEIIPENSSNLVSLYDIDQKMSGSIAITQPKREALDLTRYIIGDEVVVKPDISESLPRINIQGRDSGSKSLLAGGALIKETALESIVTEETDHSSSNFGVRKWKEDGDEYLDFYLPEQVDRKSFLQTVYDSFPSFGEAVKKNTIEDIEFHGLEKFEDEIEGGLKKDRIIDETR